MLARRSDPFDSPNHIFEVKWDGFRALVYRETDRFRLQSRKGNSLIDRFPDLRGLAALEPGTVIDGEVVAVKDGLPDFRLTANRDRTEGEVVFAAFDLLYTGYKSVMHEPVTTRRERLRESVQRLGEERMIFSETLDGDGTVLFDRAGELELEGIIAKRADSPYVPGSRSGSWKKIKHTRLLYCVVIGYIPKDDDFKSLVLATDDSTGALKYVGLVGGGFSEADRDRVLSSLSGTTVSEPVVPCPLQAIWVEPRLFVSVRFTEITHAGVLRSPVFEAIISE